MISPEHRLEIGKRRWRRAERKINLWHSSTRSRGQRRRSKRYPGAVPGTKAESRRNVSV